MRPILIRASVVAPMDRPLIRGGAVAVVGETVSAVGPVDQVRQSLAVAYSEIDLGPAVLLPGLVNAHTHLELSHCELDPPPPPRFVDWITSISRRIGRDRPGFEDRIIAAVGSGVQQCLRFGVTAVGDITSQPRLTRRVLMRGPLRAVSFGEALGLAKMRCRFESSLAAAMEGESQSDRMIVGLSPHAPYTVDLPGYAQCVRLSRERQLPLATHLAETTDEADFLQSQAGPFRRVWEDLGGWSDGVESFAGSPVAMARAVGLLDQPAILAHCNYVDDDDLSMLAAGRASVVFCPRTHAYFGHRPHRWREMLQRGINVAVGTDSCASSPDLNIVEDLRLLWRRHGHAVESEVFWSLVTTNAAHALGLTAVAGSITPGKPADLVAFACSSDVDPLGAVLDDPTAMPIGLWIAGVQISS